MQLPCPLWLGLEHLDHAIAIALADMPSARRHALTMTGELTDFFRDRRQGVKTILARFAMQVPVDCTRVYAGPSGFLTPPSAARQTDAVASANWAASAQLVASLVPDALFVDIGSTTTDLVPIRDGVLRVRGYSDAQRLASDELVYTGIVRTPVMALVEKIAFDGQWIAVVAEYFATTADVHRLTGELPAGADQLPAADNGGKTIRDSARRLARMIGRDLESAPLAKWKHCARQLAEAQLWKIRRACDGLLSRGDAPLRGPVVGAGTGRFLARKLAAQLGRRYRNFDVLIEISPRAAAHASAWASSCALAVAVALLAQGRMRK